MSDKLKMELISVGNTFLATFLLGVATSLKGGVEWTSAFWFSVLIAASRMALKAVINQFLPAKLGGKR